MRTENQFNAYLSGEFKRFYPKLTYMKTSDKYNVGVPDFFLWAYGTCRGLESKFIKKLPENADSKLLEHPFSPTQLTFLHKIEGTFNHGFGVIGCDANKIMYVIRSPFIPSNGNMTRQELQDLIDMGKVTLFEFEDIEAFFDHLFLEYEEIK